MKIKTTYKKHSSKNAELEGIYEEIHTRQKALEENQSIYNDLAKRFEIESFRDNFHEYVMVYPVQWQKSVVHTPEAQKNCCMVITLHDIRLVETTIEKILDTVVQKYHHISNYTCYSQGFRDAMDLGNKLPVVTTSDGPIFIPSGQQGEGFFNLRYVQGLKVGAYEHTIFPMVNGLFAHTSTQLRSVIHILCKASVIAQAFDREHPSENKLILTSLEELLGHPDFKRVKVLFDKVGHRYLTAKGTLSECIKQAEHRERQRKEDKAEDQRIRRQMKAKRQRRSFSQ